MAELETAPVAGARSACAAGVGSGAAIVSANTLTWEHAGVRYGVRRWDGAADAAGAAPAQTPLVLLHGFAQSAASWDEAASALAKTRPVFALDLVGHGESDRPAAFEAYALDAQARALMAFADDCVRAACGAKPVVVGYSLGGRVALAAAVQGSRTFGSCVAGLVLESAGLGPADQDERAAAAVRDERNAARLRAEGVERFMDAWEQLPLFATQRILPRAVRDSVRAGRLANDAEALARTFQLAGQHAMPARGETLAALASLPASGCPVLYLAGKLDAKYRALAGEAASALAGGEAGTAEGTVQARTIAGAGHNTHLETPASFVREVDRFLAARSLDRCETPAVPAR